MQKHIIRAKLWGHAVTISLNTALHIRGVGRCREAPFCAWYRGRTFSHCKDSRCLQKANAYTHTCTYKSSLNNSHHALWPQQNNETREGALAPPLPMPLHMHEALENVAGKHHNNKLCYTYICTCTHIGYTCKSKMCCQYIWYLCT